MDTCVSVDECVPTLVNVPLSIVSMCVHRCVPVYNCVHVCECVCTCTLVFVCVFVHPCECGLSVPVCEHVRMSVRQTCLLQSKKMH
jgi:hypothetical protein